ncbi:MAG: glycosyltransferase family 2 protein [Clostridiales bacterium]|nr:glycosyltransferase family 2 protein [Clostridiales bacterium]
MISVCIATYNGERYIKEQLESVLSNLTEEDEIVISDDGSTDSTEEMILSYCEQDQRIHFVRGKGLGVIQNFQNAISHAKGEIIFLCDQDDIWFEDKVDKVMRCFKNQACSVVVHDAIVVDDTEQVIMKSFQAFRRGGSGVIHNIVRNSYIGCCMAFRKELVPYIMPIPNNIEMHDQWIGVLGDIHGGSFFLEEPLLYYRRHGDNASAIEHYPVGKMISNRIVFCWQLLKRSIRGKVKG